jgi:hypothetical protein
MNFTVYRFDVSRTGFLTTGEVSNLVRAVCPNASQVDVEHVASMLDLDGNQGVTLAELQLSLEQDSKIEKAVGACAGCATKGRCILRDVLTVNHTVHRWLCLYNFCYLALNLNNH